MARFYKAVAMKEEQTERNERAKRDERARLDKLAKRDEESTRMGRARQQQQIHHIPYNTSRNTNDAIEREPPRERVDTRETPRQPDPEPPKPPPQILIKTDSVEDQEYKYSDRQASRDSVGSEHKWQHSSFEDDYTASTVSSDEEYSDEASLDGDVDRADYYHEEDTYNPRDKMTRRSPIKKLIEEEQVVEQEMLKPLPLPDPNFIPKPILKKREAPDIQTAPLSIPQKPNGKSITEEKLKKDTIFKKITKMPKQKSFPFPKLLSKKEPEKIKKSETTMEKDKIANKLEPDKISDEGRTIIDYYGSIVKEYGTSKKPVAPLYLNTDDLKTVAEKQHSEQKAETTPAKKITKVKKSGASKTTGTKEIPTKMNNSNSVRKIPPKPKPSNAIKPESKLATTVSENRNSDQKKCTQKVLLKKTERATIVIPIDYQELEKKAKLKVRSVIDYTVDLCLLALAFWVYLFKDERLAVPFLTLLIYRQLQETICSLIPGWMRRHTPAFLSKKTS